MKLAHLPLPGITSYRHAGRLQERLVRALLDSKNIKDSSKIPLPTIITAQFHPVYTCGRRDIARLSESDKAFLRHNGDAEFYEALRGGQTTFHGPGQLVAYPIIDLKRHFLRFGSGGEQRGFSAREYVRALEECVVRTCGAYRVRGLLTQHPGVWVRHRRLMDASERAAQPHIVLCKPQPALEVGSVPQDVAKEPEYENNPSDKQQNERMWMDGFLKICAVGVHMRRNVTSHGIALNVDTDLWWLERIVACGLEGAKATSLQKEDQPAHGGVEEVGREFVRVFANVFGSDGPVDIVEIGEADVPD